MAKIKCPLCNDVIESRHRHDFVVCKCGAIFIDGGTDYTRVGVLGKGVMLDDIIWMEENNLKDKEIK